MPTDLEYAIARKLEAKSTAKREAQIGHTLMAICLILCLANLVLVFESPAYAAAVICTAR